MPTTTESSEGVEGARVSRLSHVQWHNTIVDLLHLPADTEDLTQGFVDSAATGWFENDRNRLSVDPTLWLQYQAASEQLSAHVAGDPDLLAKVAPAPSREVFVREFGLRAFRRPLTAAEQATYENIFLEGSSIFDTGDGLADGVHAVVAAMIQSPYFLYRGLGFRGPGDETTLEGYELASKLSYGLWNTMPDDELLAAAAEGLTGDALETQVDRMIADPRTEAMIADLHRQWMHLDSYQHIYRTKEERYDDYENSTPYAMTVEAYTFVDRVIFGGGTIADLFSSRETIVESRLADVYGITGLEKETEMVPVTLDPAERAGLLTLSGFLAWQSDGSSPDLINRGAYLNHNVLCVDIPAPAVAVPPLPVDDEGLTLRERIEAHTGTCGAGCHTDYINPIGFAFGQYDEAGRFSLYENELLIDATDSYEFDEGEVAYDGAVELIEHLAVSPQAHRCYIAHLLAYTEGRGTELDDDPRLDALTEQSLDGEPILDLLRDIVLDEAFRTRPPMPED